MVAVTALGFAPWAVAVFYAARSGSELSQNIGWMQRPGIASAATMALNLVEPFYYPSTSVDSASIYRISVPLLLLVIFALAVFFVRRGVYDQDRPAIQVLFVFCTVPLVIAFAASWIFPHSIWGTRHLIIVFAPTAIMIAFVIVLAEILILKVTTITFVVLFSTYAFALHVQQPAPSYIWCAWDQLGQRWQEKPFVEPGSTKLYVFEDLVAYHFWFELRNNPNYKIDKVDSFPGVVEDKAYFIPRGFDQITVSQVGTSFTEESFWIAFRDSNPRAAAPGLSMIPYTPATIGYFLDRGFAVQDVTKITIGGETAYLVKLARPSTDR
jgi:hypothetical protein